MKQTKTKTNLDLSKERLFKTIIAVRENGYWNREKAQTMKSANKSKFKQKRGFLLCRGVSQARKKQGLGRRVSRWLDWTAEQETSFLVGDFQEKVLRRLMFV